MRDTITLTLYNIIGMKTLEAQFCACVNKHARKTNSKVYRGGACCYDIKQETYQ